MINYYSTYTNQNQVSRENLEAMYPEVFRQINPIAIRIAGDIRRSGNQLTEEMLDNYVDRAIQLSGMWDEDDGFDPIYSDSTSDSSVRPVMARHMSQRRSRSRRGHHNRNTLRDVTRLLILRELFF